ncbi:hypothetical protein [Chryseosolibacter indicus]|uniref:Uncharacterized protein n=1 Tax=Chryseosolibacter indicus TaxID=2782351 RepID=A0ABS5VX08_9BACT|nr:hypothetical protein [Chryseosolibacter indicus]MBT1705955.1 hypothetical protein [Chryseosolibacter indicus]
MALIKENDLTEGMSGKFGKKIVFRVVKGVTVASRRSSSEKVYTEKQIAHQRRFQRATQYAKAKMLDPDAKELYTKMAGDKAFNTAFSAAVRDYLVTPTILDIEVKDFKGTIGSIIPIRVSDNFKTVKVLVEIKGADNTVVESGEASLTSGDVDWKYITKQALLSVDGVKIVVTAIDRPGNETIQEKLVA